MPRGFLYGVVTLALVATAAAGCDKSIAEVPTTPGPVEVVEPDFTGTVGLNGGVTTNFEVSAGVIAVTVKSLDPNTADLTESVGVAVGLWNGTSCQLVTLNDNAGVNSGVRAQANAAAAVCVRVYDPGILTHPLDFVVGITHF